MLDEVAVSASSARVASAPGEHLHICTIIARNYLPAARVLALSFKAHHPNGTMSVLVIDDVHSEVDPRVEPFELVKVEELFEDPAEPHRMATIYDLTEFATSLKPWLLEHLLDRGSPSVLYLDPDIQVFDSLNELALAAEQEGIVLIPHARAPLPRDNKMTSESALLAVGIYNLGFIGLGQRSRDFLAFWKERLRRECLNDPGSMRFVDQRWIDFVPGMFDCTIVRNPRWNVAYWNLHERVVVWTGERYEVEGQPLGFVHFSGYAPSARHVLSRHQIERPRILLSQRPTLAKIFDEYGDALESAGFAEGGESSSEYGLARAVNGLKLDRYIRALYLRRLLSWDRGDEQTPPPDPFDPTGASVLVEWLNSVVTNPVGPSRLTLYQGTLYAYRPEIHAEFPDPQGTDFASFQSWMRAEAKEGRMDPLLLPKVTASDARPTPSPDLALAWASSDRLLSGFTVTGYMNAEHSIGQLGRLTTSAVEASHIPYQPVTYRTDVGVARISLADAGPGVVDHLDYDTNLVIVNADQILRFAATAGPKFFDGRYTIAQWAWEVEEFPARFCESIDIVDEIWAISEFTKQAIGAVSRKPVLCVPPAVVAPCVDPDFDRADLGVPSNRFMFLFCFDLFSVVERKNPVGLIDAFKRAFIDDEGPVLVIKTTNGDSRPMDLEMVRLAASDRRDIFVVDGQLPPGELGGLMASADCYVSLHRSEGFGLTMAESMALGKPVIATAYSGNLDFMNDENSFLVPFSMVHVPRGADPYPQSARWADPDTTVAAELMRQVVEHPDRAASVAARGKLDVEVHHGLEQTAEIVRNRFEHIAGLRPSTGTRRQSSLSSGRFRASKRRTRAVAAAHLIATGVGVRALHLARGGSTSAQGVDLARKVSDLAVEVDGLSSLCIASHEGQSDRNAELEHQVRRMAQRLDSVERRLSSLEEGRDHQGS